MSLRYKEKLKKSSSDGSFIFSMQTSVVLIFSWQESNKDDSQNVSNSTAYTVCISFGKFTPGLNAVCFVELILHWNLRKWTFMNEVEVPEIPLPTQKQFTLHIQVLQYFISMTNTTLNWTELKFNMVCYQRTQLFATMLIKLHKWLFQCRIEH